ncbi:MAG: hypothetical protein JXA60_09035, partial [Candidatus Coatesbacteria bacterium]|nr:hypothetical protein [Candidatus Coatesbacteria bacterium]
KKKKKNRLSRIFYSLFNLAPRHDGPEESVKEIFSLELPRKNFSSVLLSTSLLHISSPHI